MNVTPAQLTPDVIVNSAWNSQAHMSTAASQLKSSLNLWRSIAAVAGVLGGVLATLATSLRNPHDGSYLPGLLAITGAVILALVPYALAVQLSKAKSHAWVRLRLASERLKSLIYRYLMRAQPFTQASSAQDLLREVQVVQKAVEDLQLYLAAVNPQSKPRPLTLTPDQYTAERVLNQIDSFYRPAARHRALRVRRLRLLEFVLGIATLILGVLAGVASVQEFPQLAALGPWVAVVTTAGTAIALHVVESRYEYESTKYWATADRLQGIKDIWLADPQHLAPANVSQYATECEAAISEETESWMAEWISEVKKGP